MGDTFVIFLILLLIIGSITQETFIFILLYFFAGAFLISLYWINQIIEKTQLGRKFANKAFPGEKITVKLNIVNKSWLPGIWLHIQDVFPPEVATGPRFEQVVSLGSHDHIELEYGLFARKRGYYQIGPSRVSSGDVLGLVKENSKTGDSNYLTVYPRVLPLTHFSLPSSSPLGTMKHTQPIFEDPTRPTGKRDYSRGDSLRRIDWKASAVVRRLQVKQFEPSIAIETAIFLNLNSDEYIQKTRLDAVELAIVTASSIANWNIQNKQAVGLLTNGIDPLSIDEHVVPMFPHKGRGHLIQILEILARIKVTKNVPLITLLQRYHKHLSWGTTVVIITGQVEQSLYEELFKFKRGGLNPVLILCGETPNIQDIKAKSKQAGIPFFHFLYESDISIWQK